MMKNTWPKCKHADVNFFLNGKQQSVTFAYLALPLVHEILPVFQASPNFLPATCRC